MAPRSRSLSWPRTAAVNISPKRLAVVYDPGRRQHCPIARRGKSNRPGGVWAPGRWFSLLSIHRLARTTLPGPRPTRTHGKQVRSARPNMWRNRQTALAPSLDPSRALSRPRMTSPVSPAVTSDRPAPPSTHRCTGINRYLQVPAICLKHQTPKGSLFGLALGFLPLNCSPV
jgi:hypothetical protein